MEYDEKMCRDRICDVAYLLGVPESKLFAVAKLAEGIVFDVHAPDAIDKTRAKLDEMFTEYPELKMRSPSSWR